MQVELKRIQRQIGITFIFVTHDQEEALTMSDRLAVFRDGQIERIGPPAEVYERPAAEFVASFVGTSNVIMTPDGRSALRPRRSISVRGQFRQDESAPRACVRRCLKSTPSWSACLSSRWRRSRTPRAFLMASESDRWCVHRPRCYGTAGFIDATLGVTSRKSALGQCYHGAHRALGGRADA